jgi:hypothetical protein
MLLFACACGSSNPGGSQDGGAPDGGGGGTTISVSTVLSGAAASVVWAAFQDGDGAWQALSASGAGSYSFRVTGSRYGFAANCAADASQVDMRIVQATTAELSSFSVACGTPPATPTKTLSGTVSGLGANDLGIVAAGPVALQEPLSMARPMYSLAVPLGTYDFFGEAGSTQPPPITISKMVLMRDLAISADQTQNIDFGSGFAPEMHALSAQGTGGSVDTRLYFLSNRGTSLLVGGFGGASTGYFVPLANQQGNDIHVVKMGRGSPPGMGGAPPPRVIVVRFVKTPADISITFPSTLTTTATVAMQTTSPYIRYAVSLTPSTGALGYLLNFAVASGANPTLPWRVLLTPGWLGSSMSYSTPDFTSVAGWQNGWGHPAGSPSSFEVTALSSNRGLGQLLTLAPLISANSPGNLGTAFVPPPNLDGIELSFSSYFANNVPVLPPDAGPMGPPPGTLDGGPPPLPIDGGP